MVVDVYGVRAGESTSEHRTGEGCSHDTLEVTGSSPVSPSGSSCWRRFSEWTTAGVWPRLHRRLLNRLGKAGGVNLDRVVADSQSVRAKKGARTPAPTPQTAGKWGANATC